MHSHQDIRCVTLRYSGNRDRNWLLFESFDCFVEIQQQHVVLFERRFEATHFSILATGETAGDMQMIFWDFSGGHFSIAEVN
jgi:hypothetical protein